MGVGGLAGGGLPQSGQEFRIGTYDTEVDREVTYEESVSDWRPSADIQIQISDIRT